MTTWTMKVEIEWESHAVHAASDLMLDCIRPGLEQMCRTLGRNAHYHITQLPRSLGSETKQTRGD